MQYVSLLYLLVFLPLALLIYQLLPQRHRWKVLLAASYVFFFLMSKLIYAADDETNIRELIKTYLEEAGFSVRVFADGDALLCAFKKLPCDFVVLDIMAGVGIFTVRNHQISCLADFSGEFSS